MTEFVFKGATESSKSLFNRALVVQSFFPTFNIHGTSNCEDVRHMKKAVVSLLRKQPVDCGAAGTVIRFMCFRAAREPGQHVLLGTERLLSRPQVEISYILNQLGVQSKLGPEGISIQSSGWKPPMVPVLVRREDSSQFASGLALSAWNLDFDLNFKFTGSAVSEPYWDMTSAFLKSLGMTIEKKGEVFHIPAGQKPNVDQYTVEPDYSSMATLAVAALLFGRASFSSYLEKSLQPDHLFPKLLQMTGAQIKIANQVLEITKLGSLRSIKTSLAHNPDLFPTMAVLCSYASGDSILSDAPHLVSKESNRIEKTAELLKRAGIKTWSVDGGLGIEGKSREWSPRTFEFNPDQDHRMAMAAGIYKLHNSDIGIQNMSCVNKSFPDFWRVLGLQ